MTRDSTSHWTVVVVHGVGAQVRGDTALAMARSIAAVAPRGRGASGLRVCRGQEEFVDCDDADKSASFWIPTVDVIEDGATVARVCEFYWADMSQYHRGWLIHILSFLRLIVGLPRLALFAAQGAHAYKSAVFACWGLMVLRTLTIMVIHWLGNAMVLSDRQAAQIILVVDIPLNVCFLVSAIGILAANRKLLEEKINGMVGLVSVAVSFLILQSIPYAFFPTEIGTSASQTGSPNWLNRAEELYAPNTLSGIGPYLQYWVLWLAGGVLLLGWGLVVRRAQHEGSLEAVKWIVEDLSKRTAWVIKILVFSSLACLPALFVVELLFLMSGSNAPLFGLFDPLKSPGAASFTRYVVYGAIWPAAFLSGALILSADFRQAISPILEFVMDAESYLLRGRKSKLGEPTKVALRDALTGRLHALMRHLQAHSDGGVVVVAHSLGSVIVFDSLSRHGLEQQPVHLITMGSPLMKLAWAYPGVYGDSGRWAKVRGEVRSWRNLYRAADVVGRDLTMALEEDNEFAINELIGCEGHVGYFDDFAVAKAVLAAGTRTSSPESSQ